MKIVKALKKSVLMIKSVIEIIENKITEKRGGFFGALLATLDVSLLGNLFPRKGTI